MNETLITLQGYVGGDVRIRAAGESQVATIRVACTPRRFSRGRLGVRWPPHSRQRPSLVRRQSARSW